MSTSRDPQGEEEAPETPPEGGEDPQPGTEAMRERMRALARRRWEARDAEVARQRAVEDLAQHDGRVVLVRTPVEVGSIIAKLSRDAKGGDTAAARELRAWLSQFPPDDSAADASDLAAPQRSRIAALLARLIAEDEKALQAEGFEAGTQDGFDSALAQDEVQAEGHPRDDGSHRDERGSRPLTAVETPPARIPPHAETNGSHAADGTDSHHQMTVSECIEVAERGSDLEEANRE